MLTTPVARGLRLSLALVAVVALVSSCGSDGDDGVAVATSTSTTVAEETTTTEPTSDDGSTTDELFGGDVCTALDPANLSEVTGEEFDEGTAGESSCIYTSTLGSAISIIVTDVSEIPIAAAIEGAATPCDAGTVTELSFEGAGGAFTCQVEGVASVAAIGSGALVVLTGYTTDPTITTEGVIEALVAILENAIGGG